MDFGVSPQKNDLLKSKMHKLGIYEKDILEKFVRSAGKGGQNVNKLSTCVYLKHVPTQIEIKCQVERSQVLNRYIARKLLVEKIESIILGKKSEEQKRIEKIRRQKRKRSKRAKDKMLELKKQHSEKKSFRSPIRPHNID